MIGESRRFSKPKELWDHLLEINEKIDGLQRGMTTLNNKMNSLKVGQELVLWYVSGEDARFRPDDQRKVAAVKELMVKEAVGKISCGDLLSVRSVCANVFCKYQDLPGSYDNFNSFYRQVKRLIKV